MSNLESCAMRYLNQPLGEALLRTTILVLCLITLTAPSQAAQKTKPKVQEEAASRAQMCRAIVGKEEPEGTDGKSHIGQLQVQRFSDCLMGQLPVLTPSSMSR
jgi:hypothetical protein